MNKGIAMLLRRVPMLMGSEDSAIRGRDRVVCCEILAFPQPCVARRQHY